MQKKNETIKELELMCSKLEKEKADMKMQLKNIDIMQKQKDIYKPRLSCTYMNITSARDPDDPFAPAKKPYTKFKDDNTFSPTKDKASVVNESIEEGGYEEASLEEQMGIDDAGFASGAISDIVFEEQDGVNQINEGQTTDGTFDLATDVKKVEGTPINLKIRGSNLSETRDHFKKKIKQELNILEDEKEAILDTDMVELICGHGVDKDDLTYHALKLFVGDDSSSAEQPYNYSYWCKTCEDYKKLRGLPLSCKCTWTRFGEKIRYNGDLTKASYGSCDNGHPLTPIDLGLVNDFISIYFTSLMISDYPKEKKELVDSFNKVVKTESIEDIAWILIHTKAITKLNLERRGIKIEGVKVISEALEVNTTLQILNLSYNKIGCEGAEEIVNILKTNISLKELDIGYNNIGTEGAKIIIKALKVNKRLTALDLSGNNIEDEGMITINELLKINTTLERLYLSNNIITDSSAILIYEALKANTTLKKLYLWSNRFREEGKTLLKKAQEKCKHIEIFY